ncbi:MAG TPA: glycerol-3-phosphate acyltransferase [Anaerolineales bacterium]|mgnify:CR=1 FL=1|nr:glycerol-3-phosphate acyltransferase [Anaerolineales bacterium]
MPVIVLVISYLLGSIPFGLLLVRWKSGQDVRLIGSGRTGTTNTLRAAGYPIAIITFILDMAKGAAGVWLARWLAPGQIWMEVLAPIAVIVGHNYSIFLLEWDERGRLRLRGGAGGASALGGTIGLWPPSILFLIPAGILIYFGVGYASVATMSIGVFAMLLFAVRAGLGLSSWIYVVYGLLAEVLLLWALRPNIQNLLNGAERGIGWRARRKN